MLHVDYIKWIIYRILINNEVILFVLFTEQAHNLEQ